MGAGNSMDDRQAKPVAIRPTDTAVDLALKGLKEPLEVLRSHARPAVGHGKERLVAVLHAGCDTSPAVVDVVAHSVIHQVADEALHQTGRARARSWRQRHVKVNTSLVCLRAAFAQHSV